MKKHLLTLLICTSSLTPWTSFGSEQLTKETRTEETQTNFEIKDSLSFEDLQALLKKIFNSAESRIKSEGKLLDFEKVMKKKIELILGKYQLTDKHLITEEICNEIFDGLKEAIVKLAYQHKNKLENAIKRSDNKEKMIGFADFCQEIIFQIQGWLGLIEDAALETLNDLEANSNQIKKKYPHSLKTLLKFQRPWLKASTEDLKKIKHLEKEVQVLRWTFKNLRKVRLAVTGLEWLSSSKCTISQIVKRHIGFDYTNTFLLSIYNVLLRLKQITL